MKVHFWGVRGSLPASVNAQKIRNKIISAIELADNKKFNSKEDIVKFVDNELPFHVKGSYGTNTSCVQIIDDSIPEYLICDCGSGLRDLAVHLMNSGRLKQPSVFHIFISHMHWDHLSGFPFFIPAYIPGNKIIFHGYHEQVESAFRGQQAYPYFPIRFDELRADISFETWDIKKENKLCGFNIKGIEQNHPGKSYGYRFEKNGKVIIYSTDSEHKYEMNESDYPFLKFFDNADLLIFDAQYTLADAISTKEDWGHSSNIVGVELSVRSNVKHLVMFHSEPTSDDQFLQTIYDDTVRYAKIYGKGKDLKVTLGYDGLIINI